MVKPVSAPICPYCGGDAVLVKGDVIYPNTRDLDIHDRRYWYCAGDGAWVGCHEKTEKPLGRLADVWLRQAKQRAHDVFDPIWKEKARRAKINIHHARGKGYRWLAEQMGIPASEMHIGMLSIEQCEQVVAICAPIAAKLRR